MGEFGAGGSLIQIAFVGLATLLVLRRPPVPLRRRLPFVAVAVPAVAVLALSSGRLWPALILYGGLALLLLLDWARMRRSG